VAVEPRSRVAERLASEQFDVLVVGGGIVGAGVAAAAGHAGLRVALVERGDFAGATSSASSKLIHGGLRYLRLGDVRLVREAHQERRMLMRVVAPHLVRRLRFLLPLYEDGPHRPWFVQSGVLLYSGLARGRLSWLVPPPRARALAPGLRLDGLRSCALYADSSTNDARLCLANVRAAAEAGAVVLNRAELVALRGAEGAEVAVDGRTVTVRARAVVNATGPWVDHVRRLEDPAAKRSVRLSKGAHVLLPLEGDWGAALTIPQDAARVTFAIPWEGMLMLGTTDTLFEGDPAEVEATEEDVATILDEAAVALEPSLLHRERVRAAFAGLRVLPGGDGDTVNARRETVYSRGPGGMLSVAGGKLTTYRRIALDTLEHLRADLGLHRLDRSPWPLPGATGLDSVALPPELPPATREHLVRLYGSLAPDVVAPARLDPALLEPLHPDGPDIAAQAVYAASDEWANSPEDVLRRRTTVWLRGLATDEVRERVSAVLRAEDDAGVRS
jgi:glycerol-3-phosphate dehydrogenase